jgi:hypothetical protein
VVLLNLVTGLPASAAEGTQPAPLGAWRTTNQCFLAAFLLTADGRAQALYASGESADDAAWSWDGSTLRISAPNFPLDRFTGGLTNDRIDADYVWHDLDKDELHQQRCRFERLMPSAR